MKYVRWQGERWRITNIEIQRPRIVLTIGGIYNGPDPNNINGYNPSGIDGGTYTI